MAIKYKKELYRYAFLKTIEWFLILSFLIHFVCFFLKILKACIGHFQVTGMMFVMTDHTANKLVISVKEFVQIIVKDTVTIVFVLFFFCLCFDVVNHVIKGNVFRATKAFGKVCLVLLSMGSLVLGHIYVFKGQFFTYFFRNGGLELLNQGLILCLFHQFVRVDCYKLVQKINEETEGSPILEAMRSTCLFLPKSISYYLIPASYKSIDTRTVVSESFCWGELVTRIEAIYRIRYTPFHLTFSCDFYGQELAKMIEKEVENE